MLELRPNCELCDKNLPPESSDAHICSYECTYCTECVERLQNVCPTCGGNFVPRPIRPKVNHRAGKALGRENHPASSERVHSQWSETEINQIVDKLAGMPPSKR